ncbi:hypothetical protein [Pseudomonas sp. MWU15-20650]|uniref:hypothetical protein n=1 Tax=Pseudomonas sp. MWU15-20650 TaxID=2933107 RepID=UPI00200C8937|nr:hypothetical protein [Pseudomonas sp. MWU15-20650]
MLIWRGNVWRVSKLDLVNRVAKDLGVLAAIAGPASLPGGRPVAARWAGPAEPINTASQRNVSLY